MRPKYGRFRTIITGKSEGAAHDLSALRRLRVHDDCRHSVAAHDGRNRPTLQVVQQPDGAIAQSIAWRADPQAPQPAPPPSLYKMRRARLAPPGAARRSLVSRSEGPVTVARCCSPVITGPKAAAAAGALRTAKRTISRAVRAGDELVTSASVRRKRRL